MADEEINREVLDHPPIKIKIQCAVEFGADLEIQVNPGSDLFIYSSSNTDFLFRKIAMHIETQLFGITDKTLLFDRSWPWTDYGKHTLEYEANVYILKEHKSQEGLK